jgi:hypothetical protein
MTDLQTLTALFARAHIACVIAETRENSYASGNGLPLPAGMTITAARVTETTRQSFGHLGFFAELYFDHEGALVGIGAWE